MEHKNLVVTLFEEICSDPQTLAEIFLNYDCDLSAVDLFHRIVNTLGKVARSMEIQTESTSILGSGTARMEKARSAQRQLRLEAMKALRQVLASLHGSIVKPMWGSEKSNEVKDVAVVEEGKDEEAEPEKKKNLVEIYGSKKKRQEEASEIFLRFNQKPSAGLAYAAKCGHLDGSDHNDVARFLLANKDKLDTTQIGEYLGREPEYQGGFAVKVLHGYVNSMDFEGLVFDDAIRHYLSGFRLPGEAQKVNIVLTV
jgi:brefeldin A-inhibited guanine nucleotide-exchange protein